MMRIQVSSNVVQKTDTARGQTQHCLGWGVWLPGVAHPKRDQLQHARGAIELCIGSSLEHG